MKTVFNIFFFVISLLLLVPTFLILTSFNSKPGDAMYEIKTSVAEMFFGRVGTDTYRRYQK